MTRPAVFRQPRLLIVGCGNVGMRVLPLVRGRCRVLALTSQPERCAELRAAGAIPIVADLDRPETLHRLRGLADWVLHLAPPQPDGAEDRRTRHLVAAIGKVGRLAYVSTTGVYGDCGGELVHESRPVAPKNARARRRVDAERVLRAWALVNGTHLSILRAPGIYAADRLPLKRLELGTPALRPADDVYTSHIHADDLARIAVLALFRARGGRVVHAVDDTRMKMADYFDAVADAFGMARPPRLARAELQQVVTPTLLSYMSESRRLDNTRLKRELRMRLRYPDVAAALRSFSGTIANQKGN
ncbi:NAD-dependent epimerase/dehydratase family protein [Telluria aromaticivorans]|uniref:SDR family NAD(P)-dependent oxidoreductase n=1 Tax=Telluria aromaticivorans TaxID=2725995 RepID=A0A7Y2K2W5_9BURK|nr:NAD-dependent epimerase/dehydratase family protein [Telluria aromaticivorans]NNG24424.1 SDR family NAD(P)-dependent oxidoreductase [Telluria aromaticivorans]